MDNRAMAREPIQVKDNIVILRNLAYINAELTKILCGWIPGTALWELKLHLARCQWENASIAQQLRKRLGEFPEGKMERAVHPNLIAYMEAMAASPDGPSFIQAIFGVLKPYLISNYQLQLETTDSLVDSPTVDILEKAMIQEQRHIETALNLYNKWNISEEQRLQDQQRKAYMQKLTAELGSLHSGDQRKLDSLKPFDKFRPSPIGLRDDRFETSFSQEAPVEHLDDEDLIYEVKVVMTYFKEMQAVETVATSLYEVKGMPWEFYYETSRHCWDEARHCMMGQRRFEQLGFDITRIKMMNGNYAVRQLLDPLYRYSYITMVEEAGSMSNKRKWVENLERRGRTLTARLVEYDIADERNHVNNGFRWIPEILKARGDNRSLQEVVEEAKKQRGQAFDLIRIDYQA